MKAESSEPAVEADLLWPDGLDDICVFTVLPRELPAAGESKRAEPVPAGTTDPRRESKTRRSRRSP